MPACARSNSGAHVDTTVEPTRVRVRKALRFVLSDLGWGGYLGFVEEGKDNLHIGCSPTSRDFFSSVFQESVGKREYVSAQ